MNSRPLYVTAPTLPDLDEFKDSLEKIWSSKWITNNGSFHTELETALAEYLGVEYISLFSNGTLALVTAIQALGLTGEVITTPFSFVATTHALWWNKIVPVFADIDPKTGNLDPKSVEKHLGPQTTAILPVHVYGVPCDIDAFESLARKNNLRIIYDAAHAFGVKNGNGQSILKAGDLSILSFHATKIFNTIEGGAIVSHSLEQKRKIDRLKNFGFVDEVTVAFPGINAKMNELQAAYGLLQLKSIDQVIKRTTELAKLYDSFFRDVRGITPMIDAEASGFILNYSYYPVRVKNDCILTRDDLYEKLKDQNIFTRRYFYPLITDFSPYDQLDTASLKNLPVASRIATEVLCLPIFPSMTDEDVSRVMGAVVGML